MRLLFSRKSLLTIGLFTLTFVPSLFAQNPMTLSAKFKSAAGWVKPGETYPFFVNWEVGPSGATSATIIVSLPATAVFVSATPAPTSTSPLSWNLGALGPNASGQILVRARALDLLQDPEIIWKDLSATAAMSATVAGVAQPQVTSKTRGPKVTTLRTARYGERPFPVVMVQYQDIKRCTGVGEPYDECTGDHTASALDAAVNSQTTGKSLWQLYQDMSFGQLYPVGAVRPAVGSANTPFNPAYPHKFSLPMPGGTCSGATIGAAYGTPLYPTRIENGWYVLPGNQGYYGSDGTGHALAGSLTGQGLLFGVDNGCGPPGKIVYDAASLADPDLDYNEFDTDKDGWVDFFNLMFAGDGGNGSLTPTGINNVWPHKSDLRYYFKDANGETGYVSNDQLRNHEGQLIWWTDSWRKEKTTTNTGIPVFVRVGPYNVNPESAVEKMSVIAHEYGHSLGLPDFYSQGSRQTMGSWELMGTDYAQFMTVFSRQDLGWIVPVETKDAIYTLQESKKDTHTITWNRPDGTPYILTGPEIHNGDALRVQLPRIILIDQAASGTRVWHSGAGHDFGCPGHTLDVYLPDLQNYPNANAISLKFKSYYEIEWDWDYGFVLASTDGGRTWKSLPSKKGTTLSDFNPNNAECYPTYQNGITGVSGERNEITNPNRNPVSPIYPTPIWIDDEFDLTEFKGQELLLRFSYFTDPATAKRGWFIDDIAISADGNDVYRSDFETSEENTRLFPNGFARISSSDGGETDHAYYVEVRDRVGWDKDGKLQSSRGIPTWAPGMAILYTDENHGYGNVRVDGQPAQTVVDSQPQPGNSSPNLDDAAFTQNAGDDKFNGCTHVDNYKTEAGTTWKLPSGVNFTVSSLGGLSADGVTSNASATVIADVAPDCSLVMEPPLLGFGPSHVDPETDGTVELAWTRPNGAIGPDEVQEATLLTALINDNAENGLGQWITTNTGTGAFNWETSDRKKSSGKYAFWARTLEGATNVSSILTFAQPIALPAAGTANLAFTDWYMHEGDDKVAVEVSEDGGGTWSTVYEGARSAQANDAALAFATETMTQRTVSLASYKGKTINLRFRFIAGPENRPASTPLGWWVDDIRIEASNWYGLATVPATSYTRGGLTTGNYFYRVRTSYAGGPVGTPSPWSNVVTTGVEKAPDPPQQADLVVASIRAVTAKGSSSARTTVTAVIANRGNATAGASKTRIAGDAALLGIIATPPLAPGGSVEVTVQWPTNGFNGQHTVAVTGDDGSEVSESNETNNAASATYAFKGGKVQ